MNKLTVFIGFMICGLMLVGPAQSDDILRLVQMSDTHVYNEKTADRFEQAIQTLSELEPLPDALLVTGDLTQYGFLSELAAYKTIADKCPVPVYQACGNHDSRWAPNGKQDYQRLFGDPYYSFDLKGYHIIVLDTSVLVEQYGHIDADQMKWLEQNLEKVSEEIPIIVAFHHPTQEFQSQFLPRKSKENH